MSRRFLWASVISALALALTASTSIGQYKPCVAGLDPFECHSDQYPGVPCDWWVCKPPGWRQPSDLNSGYYKCTAPLGIGQSGKFCNARVGIQTCYYKWYCITSDSACEVEPYLEATTEAGTDNTATHDYDNLGIDCTEQNP